MVEHADQPFEPEMIEAYLLGELPGAHVGVLERALRDDAAVRRQFAVAMQVMSMVREEFRGREEQGTVTQAEPMLEDFNKLLGELSEAEQRAEAEMVHWPQVPQKGNGTGDTQDRRPDLKEVGEVLLYLGRQPRVWMPLAAVLALAVSVTVGLLVLPGGQSDPSPQPLATGSDSVSQPDTSPREPTQRYAASVATLTGQHQARWSSGPRAIGDILRAGDILTLTAGYAQVTTQRGAVAILEAPATVELIDHANALRLHRGQLVGICETASSKGFLVRTPHMDVMDLGTRFGVHSSPGQSRVSVFEGDVLATATPASPTQAAAPDAQPLRIKAGQSAVADTNTPRVTPTDHAPARFMTSWRALAAAPAITGQARYEPKMPEDLRVGAYENNDILIFHEQSGLSLQGPITVNVIEAGAHADQALLEPVAFDPPTRVDTYLIHLDLPTITDNGQVRTATVRFDRPILAVVTSGKTMAQSHAALGLAGVRYGTASAGGNPAFTGLDMSKTAREAIEISDDRRTLTLHLSTGAGIDQARVLVESDRLADPDQRNN